MENFTVVSAKVDSALKNDAESILTALGLTASQAINLFYNQITFQNGLPFPVKIPYKVLNEKTRKALVETDLEEFKDTQALYNELGI